MNFTDQLFDITDKARARIVEVLTARGTNYELTDPNHLEQFKDGDLVYKDILFYLPSAIKNSKHGLNERCAITVINMDNHKRLTFEGVSLEFGTDEVFEYSELEITTICEIAELVNTL